ncbi:unnamed protein product [Bursaphelenchus xylophilus]|uniref:(pine wood nematode) hypothetical protein n=1 Tax=Bursaphelenchus xylophilus TaxID=6326 RepID=A0A1I7SU09_BURXY|nr:unnamed protein product [Bursaphelenchus xylophilus]CAG9107715.1 unnamed protein product [Bursaphelenchus xylophilus]
MAKRPIKQVAKVMALPIDRNLLNSEVLSLVETVDLKELTSKYVRNSLEKKHAVALKAFKTIIDDVIRESIKQVYPRGPDGPKILTQAESKNGDKKRKAQSSDGSDSDVEPRPSTSRGENKKVKVDDDFPMEFVDKYEQIKLRRAAQRNQRRRPQKKENGDAPKKSAFSKICLLSDELYDVLNQRYMCRSQVVKGMWDYFREHSLIDQNNKRFVIPDDKTRAIFGPKKFLAFGMMKTLKNHIHDLEFLDSEARDNAVIEIKDLSAAGVLDLSTVKLPSFFDAPIKNSKNNKEKKKANSVKESKPKRNNVKNSKDIVEDSDDDDSDEEVVEKKSQNNNDNGTGIKRTETIEAQKEERPKLVLRISKKNERMVSVSVNESDGQLKRSAEDSDQFTTPSATTTPLANDLPDDSSESNNDAPPTLQPEMPQANEIGQQDSSSSSSSSSSSGSSSSSDSSSSDSDSDDDGKKKDDLKLSESDSD